MTLSIGNVKRGSLEKTHKHKLICGSNSRNIVVVYQFTTSPSFDSIISAKDLSVLGHYIHQTKTDFSARARVLSGSELSLIRCSLKLKKLILHRLGFNTDFCRYPVLPTREYIEE